MCARRPGKMAIHARPGKMAIHGTWEGVA